MKHGERREKTSMQYREATIRAGAIDEDARTVEVSFSSETPVPRWGDLEVLDHGRGAVDLGRLKDGASVLYNHDRDRVVGVVESARIDSKDRVGRAVLRFGATAACEECFRLVADRVLSKTSVGYAVHRRRLEEGTDDGPDTVRVTRWEPYEISIVSMPADATVGVGRAQAPLEFETITELPNEGRAVKGKDAAGQAGNDNQATSDNQQGATTTPAARAEPVATPAATPPPAPALSRADADDAAQKRVADIMTLARAHNLVDLGLDFVARGKSVGAFKDAVLETLTGEERQRETLSATPEAIGLSLREVKRYSVLKLINVLAQPNNAAAREAAAFELECSQAVQQQRGDAPDGVYLAENPQAFGYDWSGAAGRAVSGASVPADVVKAVQQFAPYRRDLLAGTATDGAELVATDLLAGSFIDVLRNALVVMSMGAMPLRDLVGDVAIPRKTSGAAGGWLDGENVNAAESDPQFDQVTLTPRTCGAFTEISRQLRLQSSLDVEALVRADLMTALAETIDLAALYGTGANGQPTGISNQAGINTPTAFAAVNPTYPEVVAMETPVATANALMNRLGYVLRADMRGALKTAEKATNTAVFIWEPGNTLNGYPTGVTSQVTAGDLFFGNWADLFVALWAGLDLLVDPYTGSAAGRTRLVAHQSVDVAVRHPESFSFNNDGV